MGRYDAEFLSIWWKQASNESRNTMKKLHSTGQLEFTGEGWIMHDEADPSLFGILNQMHQGLSFLRDIPLELVQVLSGTLIPLDTLSLCLSSTPNWVIRLW